MVEDEEGEGEEDIIIEGGGAHHLLEADINCIALVLATFCKKVQVM